MRTKQTGSALFDYVIPMAIVGVMVGVGLSQLNSNQLLINFLAASANMELDLANATATVENTIEPVESSAANNQTTTPTTNTPTNTTDSVYAGGSEIDFGTFKLNGIPENYAEFIETTGAAGTTEMLGGLLSQIADQLEADGLTTESNLIKDLANASYEAGALEKLVENELKNCPPNDLKNCWYNNIRDKKISVPPGYSADFTEKYNNKYFNNINQDIELAEKVNDSYDALQGCIDSYDMKCVFAQKLKLVKDSGNLDDSTKGVITQLAYNVAAIGEEMQAKIAVIEGAHGAANIADFFNGGQTTSELWQYLEDDGTYSYEDFQKHAYSSKTELNAGLICSAGNYNDLGTKCN